jgi:hypothetical protein
MTQQRDIERLLDHWLSDGPDQAPDRVVDIVTDRIERQSQRPAWRLHWRPTSVNAYMKIAVAAAAVLIVAVVGYNLLPAGSTGTGGPAPSATPTPTAAPTATPVASGPVALPEGPLAGGRYRIQPLVSPPSLSIVADVPAGWVGHPENPALTSSGEESDGILLGFMAADGLFSDPCHWDLDGTKEALIGDVVVGPTVDDLVAALKANTSYTSSAASPVTFGRFEGQELELQLPGDDVIKTCDRRPGETTGDYFVFPGGYYAQGGNSRWHLYIVDVGGTRLITMISIGEGAPQTEITAAEAVVESFEFTP